MRQIYLDNAATTKLDPTVLEAMLPYLREKYGNPSSMHNMGIEAKNAIDSARRKVAGILNCSEKEIIFTGSGTESDNLAILGYARKNKDKGNHIITTSIEHHAVLDPFHRLEKEGFEVTILDVGKDGLVDINELKKTINDKTILVSIIYANNEIGVVQDIKEISKLCKEKNVIFHTDACQAANYLSIDVEELGIDLITLNGSKIYGPKGVGILYKREGIMLEPIVYGGGQEFGLRSGTENIANIVGFAKALEEVTKHKDKEVKKTTQLRDYLIANLLKIDETILNGHPTKRLPNNANISLLNIEGESLLLLMNEEGIYASTGSACTSDSLEPSHVIVALGLPHEFGHSSIRFSLGKDTTKQDIDYVLEKLPPLVKRLRKVSVLHKTVEEALTQKV
ncbi:cysteine desulfurase NifS [Candidatus Woesearchaeota archaeon]|nr:cysteine desulfurase NifS [Candidatus Woesearchaeota archaeon]